MTLKEFRDYIESKEENKTFDYGISEPFSWRGSYDEVAFAILDRQMTREEILDNIEMAYQGKFYGYKGGSYTYQARTYVNFERDYGSYTDGGYCSETIARIEGGEYYPSQEHRLINKAFT